MRPIKFRGKQIDNDEWIVGYYGYKELSEEHFIIVPTFDSRGSSNRPQYFTDYLVKPETVGQYTGSKDKNGKEIYEGDILQAVVDETYISVVEYYIEDFGSCGCCYEEFKGAGFKAKELHFDKSIIIGNICENPELL